LLQRPRSLCCVVCPVRTKATWSPDQGSVRPSGATADAPPSLLRCSCEDNPERSRCLGREWRPIKRNGHDPGCAAPRAYIGRPREESAWLLPCIARYSSSHSPSIHTQPHHRRHTCSPLPSSRPSLWHRQPSLPPCRCSQRPPPSSPLASATSPASVACVSRLLALLHGFFLLADQSLQRAFALPVLQLLRRHQSPVQGGQAVLGQALPAGLRLVYTS
jgi:hypothetical protein